MEININETDSDRWVVFNGSFKNGAVITDISMLANVTGVSESTMRRKIKSEEFKNNNFVKVNNCIITRLPYFKSKRGRY